MSVGDIALTGTGDDDLDGLGDLGVAGHGHHGGVAERRVCLGRNAIGGHTGLAETHVVAADGLDRHAGALGHLDQCRTRCLRRTVVQAAQTLERGEPPQLVTATGHLERIDVERGELLALVGVQSRTGFAATFDRGSQFTH